MAIVQTVGPTSSRRGDSIALSVIVPCYQSAVTIEETLASVAGQSFQSWECIVVNDGSTDNGPEIARDFVLRDSRFRLVERDNGGLSAARNTGISASNGDCLLFLDADDILLPSALNHFANALVAHPKAGMAVSDFVYVDEKLKHIANSSPGSNFCFDKVCNGGPFPVHACCLRRSVLDSTGDFDTTLRACEDWDLWIRAARIGVEAKRIHKTLVAYRKSNRSMSGDARRMFEAQRNILNRIDKPDQRIRGVVEYATADPVTSTGIRAESFCTYIGRAIAADDRELLQDTVAEVRRHCTTVCRNSLAYANFIYGMLFQSGRWSEAKVTGLFGSLSRLLPSIVWVDQQLPELELLKQLESAIVREMDGVKAERDAVLSSTSYRIARALTALKPW